MSNLYYIDRDVPMPSLTRIGRGPSDTTATITALRVGESFFVPKMVKQRRASATAKQLSSSATHVRKKHPERRFAVRTVTENRQAGARVWRVQ